MSIKNALASVPVKDLGAALHWYERLFDRLPDSRQMPDVAEWKFERGGSLQVYQHAERAGAGSFSLVVNSFDEQILAIKKCGLDAGQQMNSEQMKVVMIKDPDNNSIAFFETIGATPETRISGIIHAYFSAYERKDRPALEALLHKNFTFSSPDDPHLERSAYFERCWPNSANTSAFEIQNIVEGDGDAFVLYECKPLVGAAFSNTEYFRVEGDKVRTIRVFYGSLPK